jgi:hypothetical protein
MPMVRARELILCAALASPFAGCAGSRLSPDPPPGVKLAGAWKLNRSASDDPQKIIDQMRAEATKRMRRAMESSPGGMGGGGAGSGRGGAGGGRPGTSGRQGTQEPQDQQVYDDGAATQHGPEGRHLDPLRGSPEMHVLMSNLTRGDFLTVRQTPEQIALDYGTSVRTFSPGGHSVVSAETGVADQTSGWKNKEYVIYVRPQLGPEVVERYGLSEDGRHLVVKLHIGAFDLSKIDLTRVYDPTDEIAPRTLPTND